MGGRSGRGTVLVLLAAFALAPAASGTMLENPCSGGVIVTDGPSPGDPSCAWAYDELEARCINLHVVTPWHSKDVTTTIACRTRGTDVEVVVDDEKAAGRVSSSGLGDLPRSPWGPGQSASTTASAPGADAAAPSSRSASRPDARFEVHFELRYRPCDDPTFRAEGEAQADAPAPAPPSAGAEPALAASPACEAASTLAGADAASLVPAALDLWDALEALLLAADADAPAVSPPALLQAPAPTTTPAAAGLPAPPATLERLLPDDGACGCVSGNARGEAREDGGVTVEADLDAGAPLAVQVTTAAPPGPAAGAAGKPVALRPETGPVSSAPGPGPPAPLASSPAPAPEVSGDPPEPDLRAAPGRAPVPATRAAAPAVLGAVVAGVALNAALAGFLQAFAGYSRISRDRVLDNPLRRRVHESVRARRIASATEVARDVALDIGSVRYHLDVLRRNGLVARTPSAHGAVFHVAEARLEVPPAPSGPLEARILGAVDASPGLNMSELARVLGVCKRAVQNHVLALLAEGKLAHRREAGARRLYPAHRCVYAGDDARGTP